MSKIFVEKDFLTQHECEVLIRAFQNMDNRETFRNTRLCSIMEMYSQDDFINYVLSKICYFAQSSFCNPDIYIRRSQIVEWENEGMIPHYDLRNQICSAIVYLNDDYEGGETLVDDIAIKPQTGKIVCFDGSTSPHSVNPFRGNTRYTIANWFGNGAYTLNH